MSNIILATIIGGLIGLLGAFIGGGFQYLIWKKKQSMNYWENKLDRIERYADRLPDLFDELRTRDDFTNKFVTQILLYFDPSVYDELINAFKAKEQLSDEDKAQLSLRILGILREQKLDCERNIESITKRWF